MHEKVDVVLASYQGGLYIREQILSILNQSHPYIHIWVRDDGSKDDTIAIVKALQQEYPGRITLLPTENRLGVKGNFSELMAQATADYVFFADQDDKWLPNKVEITLKRMKKLEAKHGTDTPLLVHTDLAVVRADLSVINPSFWKYSNLKPSCSSLNRLLVQNVITGCTVLINRPLLNLCLPIPAEAIMHDWWIGLVAAAFGHIDYVKTSTMLYRQHGKNDTGAKKYSLWNELKKMKKEINKIYFLFNPQAYQPDHAPTPNTIQAHAFLKRYQSSLTPYQQKMIKTYLDLPHLPYLHQKKAMLRFQFFKNSWLANCYRMIKMSPR